MKFRRQKLDEVSVNLTPLIDVVFLLLIFFMVSTTFRQSSELTIELPQATAAVAPTEAKESIEILVTAEGQYSINGMTLINEQTNTLKQGILEISEGDVERPLIITADAKASYEMIMRVYDAAAQLGFAKLAHTTSKETAQ